MTSDRIIGCPHEEGIDYPMGRTCPRCPFWAGIDRFTHEPVTTPVPTLSPAEILAELSADEPDPPYEALPVFSELRRAYDEGLVDPQVMGRSELDDVEAAPRGWMLEKTQGRYPPIDDVVEATAWW